MKVFFFFCYYGDTTVTRRPETFPSFFCLLLITPYICSHDLLHNLLSSCPPFSSSSLFPFIAAFPPSFLPFIFTSCLLSALGLNFLLFCPLPVLPLPYLVFTRFYICLTDDPHTHTTSICKFPIRQHSTPPQQHDGKPVCLNGPLILLPPDCFPQHTHRVLIHRGTPTCRLKRRTGTEIASF